MWTSAGDARNVGKIEDSCSVIREAMEKIQKVS